MMPSDIITCAQDAAQVARMAKRAAYMREYSRNKGSVPVKGIVIFCARCGSETEKQHSAHNNCASCVKPAQREAKVRKRAEKGTVSIGSALICKHCGAAFTKSHKRQFYCPPCSKISAAGALPAARERTNEYQKARNKAKRQADPAFAIRERMTSGVKNSLRDGKNGRSWEALVGYTISDLMLHLERQFSNGMNWENRGRWHIDHIVPLASFAFSTTDDPEFKAAWALSNLRPLWAAQNIRKSAKRTHLI